MKHREGVGMGFPDSRHIIAQSWLLFTLTIANAVWARLGFEVMKLDTSIVFARCALNVTARLTSGPYKMD